MNQTPIPSHASGKGSVVVAVVAVAAGYNVQVNATEISLQWREPVGSRIWAGRPAGFYFSAYSLST